MPTHTHAGLFGGALFAAGITSAVAAPAAGQYAAAIVDSIPTDAYEVPIPGYPLAYSAFSFEQMSQDGNRIVAQFRHDAYSGDPDYIRRFEDQLLTFDISTPADMQLVGRWQPEADLDLESGIAVIGDTLVTKPGNGSILDIYDFSTPSTPVVVNSFSPAGLISAFSLTEAGDKVLVAGRAPLSEGAFAVVDVSDPLAPTGEAIIVADAASGVPLFGTASNGLLPVLVPFATPPEVFLYDITGPQPVLISSIMPPSGSFDAVIVRDTLVLQSNGDTLQAFDISNPAQPVFLSEFASPVSSIRGMSSFEQLVPAINDDNTEAEIDYTDPANPFLATTNAVAIGDFKDSIADERGFIFSSSGPSFGSNQGNITAFTVGDCATPTILSLTPGDVTDAGGDPVVLQVDQLNGSRFQWMLEGTPIADDSIYSGVSTPTLTIAADPSAVGFYSVEVSNTGSSIVAGDAIVAVRTPPRCLADQNLDAILTPADFNAWILNYNAGTGCP
ncbi:MAG: hypothetical protein AAFS11_00255 [Planctomycetota bacterium]